MAIRQCAVLVLARADPWGELGNQGQRPAPQHTALARNGQGLLHIGDDVVHMLDADGQAHQVL
jgi:hypothetical protein